VDRRDLIRDPLLHFVVAGAMLFAAYELLSHDDPGQAAGPVHIGDGDVRWLSETFASQWRRAPSAAELRTLVDGLVEEELLAREARALGLDEDDTVVRRRLAQKMAFLVDDTARLAEPGDEELRAFFAAHPDRFRKPARVSFAQVYFSPERRRDVAADARAALAAIPAAAEAGAVGDPIPLDPAFRELDRGAVAGLFGEAFADAVFRLAPGRWAGPVASGYGLHLVRVSAVTPAALPAFEAVRAEVLAEWRREQEAAARAGFLARLREKYGVIVEAGIDAAPAPQRGPAQ
jgi:hypothetical protein